MKTSLWYRKNTWYEAGGLAVAILSTKSFGPANLLKFIGLALIASTLSPAMASLPLPLPLATGTNVIADGTVTMLVAGSSILRKYVVEQADSETRQAIAQADAAQRRAFKEARRADINARQAAAAQQRLAETTKYFETLLTDIAKQNVSLKAGLAVYRQGVQDLAKDPNPDIQAAMARYAEGDVAALDELQELVRLVRKAEAAALQRKHADDQRAVARIYYDAYAKGEISAKKVMDAWVETADLDPTDFQTQLRIANLALSFAAWDRTKVALQTAATVLSD